MDVFVKGNRTIDFRKIVHDLYFQDFLLKLNLRFFTYLKEIDCDV